MSGIFNESDGKNITIPDDQKATFSDQAENKLTYTSSKNIETNVIEITEDKLKNYLRDYNDLSAYPGYFFGCLGIVITLVITLVTVDNYKDMFGLRAAVWEALFVLISFVALVVLIYFFYICLKNLNKLKINYLIKRIKGDKDEQEKECCLKSLFRKS